MVVRLALLPHATLTVNVWLANGVIGSFLEDLCLVLVVYLSETQVSILVTGGAWDLFGRLHGLDCVSGARFCRR